MQPIRHVAIIPDGNRRWAKQRALESWDGHEAGIQTFKKILTEALELNIPYITLWGASRDNIKKRDVREISFLFKILAKYLRELLTDSAISKHKVRIRVLGAWEKLFPKPVSMIFKKAIRMTHAHDAFNLTFLMGYDGKEEMLSAIQGLGKSGEPISSLLLKKHLWTAELPPVDLVIRTGGEPHWSSGFMMWDVADAELYFTETLWPAFSPAEFRKAVQWAAGTERRLGK